MSVAMILNRKALAQLSQQVGVPELSLERYEDRFFLSYNLFEIEDEQDLIVERLNSLKSALNELLEGRFNIVLPRKYNINYSITIY